MEFVKENKSIEIKLREIDTFVSRTISCTREGQKKPDLMIKINQIGFYAAKDGRRSLYIDAETVVK